MILASLAPAAGAQCRLSLQLALDVSGSVDAREYRLQLDGLAWALETEEVAAALLAVPAAPVALSVYEWSGRADQRLILDWSVIRNPSDIAQAAALLRETGRTATTVSTGLGTALMFAGARRSTGPDCARSVLDVSGDGKNNHGPRPQDVRGTLVGMVVNALVIGPGYDEARGAMARETQDLVRYFQRNVIHGPKAFVEVAEGYDDFADAMKRKLLKELQAMAVSEAPPRGQLLIVNHGNR